MGARSEDAEAMELPDAEPAPTGSGGVCLGSHVVPAPAGRDPGEEAGCGLFQLPAILPFDLMMPATGWYQIAKTTHITVHSCIAFALIPGHFSGASGQ